MLKIDQNIVYVITHKDIFVTLVIQQHGYFNWCLHFADYVPDNLVASTMIVIHYFATIKNASPHHHCEFYSQRLFVIYSFVYLFHDS